MFLGGKKAHRAMKSKILWRKLDQKKNGEDGEGMQQKVARCRQGIFPLDLWGK